MSDQHYHWIKIRYTDPDGNIIAEPWTQVLVQFHDAIDRMHEDAMIQILTPHITGEIIVRQVSPPKLK